MKSKESRTTQTGRGCSLIRFLTFAVLVLAAISCSQPHSSVVPEQRSSVPAQRSSGREPIAKAYGLDSFEQIEGIRYTFNLQFPGVNVSRSWEWEPKTGKV